MISRQKDDAITERMKQERRAQALVGTLTCPLCHEPITATDRLVLYTNEHGHVSIQHHIEAVVSFTADGWGERLQSVYNCGSASPESRHALVAILEKVKP